jgi:hypothetical protein
MVNRTHVLVVVLIATAIGVWLGRDDDASSGVVDAVTRTNARTVAPVDASPERVATSDTLTARDEREPSVPIENAFRVVSFLPPPPEPVIVRPVEAPKPVAPTFPYRFFGRVNDGTDDTVYLARADKLVPVVPAQIVDETYRIDSITATEVRITYLPLKEQTILTLPSGR